MIELLKGYAAEMAVERGLASEAELRAAVEVDLFKAAEARASQQRAKLTEALSQATVAADATAARLGDCRSELAKAERDVERLADAASAGRPSAEATAR